MIKFENCQTYGWEQALRAIRNMVDCTDDGDSVFCKRTDCAKCELVDDCEKNELDFDIGNEDFDLMMSLAADNSICNDYREMITVYVDITAPQYWWQDFVRYKIAGNIAMVDCNIVASVLKKRLEREDFSIEYLYDFNEPYWMMQMDSVISLLNAACEKYLDTDDIKYLQQISQLLPSSYNEKRVVSINYKTLAKIYKERRDYNSWSEFCKWIRGLPYSSIIIVS